jgi:hypothetical protein
MQAWQMLKRLKIGLLTALFGAYLVGGFYSQLFAASAQSQAQQQANRPSEIKQNSQLIGTSTDGLDDRGADKLSNTSENKGWLADFLDVKLTDLLIAIFTGVLAWKTAGLFTETERLREAADKQAADFLRSVQAAEKAALAAETSAETAKTEFVSTHRPRIILREAISGTFLDGQPIAVIFQLANIGDTAGTVVKSYVRVDIVPRGPIPLLHASVEQHNDLGEIVLGPGQAILLKFQGDTPKWDTNRFQEKSYMSTSGTIPYRDATIHFSGQLIYKDHGPGIWRRTAFRRQLIPERQRFYRIPDEPDLEYSD